MKIIDNIFIHTRVCIKRYIHLHAINVGIDLNEIVDKLADELVYLATSSHTRHPIEPLSSWPHYG